MGKTQKKRHKQGANIRHKRRRDKMMQRMAIFLCGIIAVSSFVVAGSQMIALGNGKADEADAGSDDIDVQKNDNGFTTASNDSVTEIPEDGKIDTDSDTYDDNDVENTEISAEQAEQIKQEELSEIMHSAKYPGQLKELAQKNEEAINFVYDYPTEHEKEHTIDLTEEASMDTVPLLIQWDERWGYEKYSGNFLAASGCGPTTLSMVVLYLTHNAEASPLAVAEYSKEAGYSVDGSGSAWALISEGCRHYGVRAKSMSINEDRMKAQLDAGNLIVVNVGPGDFTDDGHFMVITGYDDEGFSVNDPNSIVRSGQRWSFETLSSQIRAAWRMYT
ncbi:C39 family peptidase [Agathobacter sp.]